MTSRPAVIRRSSGLQRQMMLYVLFIGTVFGTLAVEMLVFLNGPRVHGAVTVAAESCGCDRQAFEQVLHLVLLKVGLMLAILLLAVALVMTLFIKRITIPLARLIAGAARIGAGDLSHTLAVGRRDELGRLAGSINDLAANYQELLLLADDAVGRARQQLRRLADGDGGGQAVSEAGSILSELQEVLDEFAQSYYGRTE